MFYMHTVNKGLVDKLVLVKFDRQRPLVCDLKAGCKTYDANLHYFNFSKH